MGGSVANGGSGNHQPERQGISITDLLGELAEANCGSLDLLGEDLEASGDDAENVARKPRSPGSAESDALEDAEICCGILKAVETTQERATCGSATGGAKAAFFLAVNFRITT